MAGKKSNRKEGNSRKERAEEPQLERRGNFRVSSVYYRMSNSMGERFGGEKGNSKKEKKKMGSLPGPGKRKMGGGIGEGRLSE